MRLIRSSKLFVVVVKLVCRCGQTVFASLCLDRVDYFSESTTLVHYCFMNGFFAHGRENCNHVIKECWKHKRQIGIL